MSATAEAAVAPASVWPELALPEWEETRRALHMWTQVVGKVRLALEPMVNHWWQVPLSVSARGLTTSLMHAGGQDVEMEFDFIDHVLDVRGSNGKRHRISLPDRSVASFYSATMASLEDLDVAVAILPRPVEVPEAVPFPEDTRRVPYDADAVHRYWLALVHAHRVMSIFRSRFTGKASPVQYFWGGPDLAVTRFSGRPAPKHPGGVPNCADWVQVLAYSHELSSCGYWPGGGEEGIFYAYAYPEPDGFRDRPVEPEAARFDPELGEFVLAYTAVRTAADPDATLLGFLQSTYEAAADLAGWDRTALEVQR